MSEGTAAPATAPLSTDVPATPTDAVAGDPLGPPTQAVTQEPAARRPSETLLAIADTRASRWAGLYFGQVHKTASFKVVSSWSEMIATIVGFDRISHLVLLTHSTGSSLECGPPGAVVQMTPGQLADELLKHNVGSIGQVSFDGCSIGEKPTELLGFMSRLRVPRVEAFTWGHWLDGWTVELTGDTSNWTPQDVIAKFAGQLEKASPYLPDGAGEHDGSFSATALAELLLRHRTVTWLAEVFIERAPPDDFETLMEDPAFQFSAKFQVPRSGATTRNDIRTPDQAADFEGEIWMGGPLYRVVLRA